MKDPRIDLIVSHYDPQPRSPLWHGGATVLGAIRGVSHTAAAWRPAANRHSIWELVLHVTYWKYAVLRNITGAEKGTFPRSPSDWPDQPENINQSSWKADRTLLRFYHAGLLEAMAGIEQDALDHSPENRRYTRVDLLMGIVLHDTHHTGQIQLIKRLYESG